MLNISTDFYNFFGNVDILEENDQYLVCVNCKNYSKNKVYKIAKVIAKISYKIFYNFSTVGKEYFSFYAKDEIDVIKFFDEFIEIYNSFNYNEELTLKDDRNFYCEFLSCGSHSLKQFLKFCCDNNINVLSCFHKSNFEKRLGISFDIEEAYEGHYNFFDILDISGTIMYFLADKILVLNLDISDDGIFYKKLLDCFKIQNSNSFKFLEMLDFFSDFSIKKVDDEYIVSWNLIDVKDKDKLYKLVKASIDINYLVLYKKYSVEDLHFGFKVKSLDEINSKFLELKKYFDDIKHIDYEKVNTLYKKCFNTNSDIDISH